MISELAAPISLGIHTNTLSVGNKISRVNPSESVGKSVGKARSINTGVWT